MILHVFYGEKEPVGRLAEDLDGGIWFQYAVSWLREGWSLSPMALPFVPEASPGPRNPSFHGLHGVFYDSLPDYWGGKLLDERMVQMGIDPETASPLTRLSYIGSRGMGALSYQPEADPDSHAVHRAVSLAQIDREASLLLEGKPLEGSADEILALVQAGSSAGGAKPKVHASVLGDQIHIGPNPPAGFEPWIVKLSDVPAGHKDSKQSGRVEFAYSLMARAAGIEIPETRLFEVKRDHGNRGLFAVRRFDRQGEERIHMHSLAGLLHRDFNADAVTYEDFARVALELTGDHRTLAEIYRRLAFNVVASNCDDHAKNFAFLCNRAGQWSLSPAFDLTRSPGIGALGRHAMSVSGSRNPNRADLEKFATLFGIAGAPDILGAVVTAVQRWEQFADEAGLREAVMEKIHHQLVATADSVLVR